MDKLGHYLCMYPKFDWKSQNIRRIKFEKAIVIITIIFFLTLSTFLMYYRFSLVQPLFPVSQIILEALTTIVSQLLCVGALTSLITYETLWMDYFDQIYILSNFHKLKCRMYNFKLFILVLGLYLFWLVTNAVFINYIYGHILHVSYIDVAWYAFYHLICSYFIVNFVKYIRQCLSVTNKLLKQKLVNKSVDLPKEIRNTMIIYEEIRTLNKAFEDLFGWRILLIITGGFLLMLNTFNFLIRLILEPGNFIIITTSTLLGLYGVVSIQ